MLTSVLGRKVGMTQIFDSEGNVVSVTVINIENLYITQIKTDKKDGYTALQVGFLKKKYQNKDFSRDWLRTKKRYFSNFREIKVEDEVGDFDLGQRIIIDQIALQEGQEVAVVGTSRGLGFQGVVKRWGFGGGPSSHGSKLHRKPGAISHMRRQGEVIKGKKLPGRMGCKRFTIRGLKVIRKENGFLFVKGSVPGKKDSLILVRRQGK